MADIEKDRIQHEAKRTVAGGRTTGSAQPHQAMIRHLGVELYRERRRTDHPADAADAEKETPGE